MTHIVSAVRLQMPNRNINFVENIVIKSYDKSYTDKDKGYSDPVFLFADGEALFA